MDIEKKKFFSVILAISAFSENTNLFRRRIPLSWPLNNEIKWKVKKIAKTYKLLRFQVTATGDHLVDKRTLDHLAKLTFLNDWAVLWVLICTVHLTVWFYHATYAFHSESTLYSCLNVKELLVWSRREIWSLSDCNWTQTQNHLVHKRTLNRLAKLSFLNDCVLLWVLICTVHLTVCFYHVTYASPHSIVASMSRNSLLKADTKSEV